MIGRQAESSGDSSSPIPPSAMASRRHAAAPLFNDRLPSNAGRHLLQDVVHQDPGSSECRLAMADGGIGDDESPDDSACLPIILAVGHVEPLKHDYSPNRRKSRCT